MTSFKS